MIGYLYYNYVKALPIGVRTPINNWVAVTSPSGSPYIWVKIIFSEKDIVAKSNIGAVFINEGIILELV